MTPYLAAYTRGFRRTLYQPADLVSQVVFFVVILVVLSQLWHAAIEASGGMLAGYGYGGLLWYIAAAQATVGAVSRRTVEEAGDEIGSGEMSMAMLRPVVPVCLRMSIASGESSARLLALCPVGAVFAVAVAGPPPSLGGLALALPSIVIGCIANTAGQHAFGGVAFWLRDARSAWFLYQKVVFLPGGMLIPLELFPRALAAACVPLPFAAMAYVPGRLASGHVEPALLALQVAWTIVLLLTAVAVFSRGQRRLTAVGG